MELHLAKEPCEWRVVQQGLYVFLDLNYKPKDIDELTSNEFMKFNYNNRARNTMMTGLCPIKSDNVSSGKSAIEI